MASELDPAMTAVRVLRISAHQDYLDDIHEVSEEPRPSDFTGKAGLVRCFPWLDEVTGRWSGRAGR